MFPHDRQNLAIKKSFKFPKDVNIVMTKYYMTTIPNNIFLPTKQSESSIFLLNILIIKCSVGWSIIGWLTPYSTKFHLYSFLLAKKKKDPKTWAVFWSSKEVMELHSFWNLYFIITRIILIKYLFKRLQSKRLSNCYNIFKNYVFNFLKRTAIRHELNNLTIVTSGEITM